MGGIAPKVPACKRGGSRFPNCSHQVWSGTRQNSLSKALMSPADAFDLLRSALERAGVRYAVGGSWASTAFGEPRFTNDVDILAEFTEENLPRFLSFLPKT